MRLFESKTASLTIFDIDDTLFTTDTKIHIVKGGQRIKSLTPAEFNVYKVKSGESLDFSDFRSAEVFQKTAKPIATVFKTAKSIISRFSAFANKKIVIVTARGDLDNKNVFLDTFKKYGFDISKVYVHRAGNVGGPDSAQNKKVVIRDLIKDGKYEMVRLFDDSKPNLDALHELESEFPDTKFETFFVAHDGTISRYKTTK
jgi:hypothetical protein